MAPSGCDEDGLVASVPFGLGDVGMTPRRRAMAIQALRRLAEAIDVVVAHLEAAD
jgi:hypothetical protein